MISLSGAFDPFSSFANQSNSEDAPMPSVYIGVVKSYDSARNSVVVTIPAINSSETMGPFKVIKPYVSGTTTSPTKGQSVVVLFLEGKMNSAVVLGRI